MKAQKREMLGKLMRVRAICRVLAAGVVLAALVGTAPAAAETPEMPWWKLSSRAAPTDLAPGSESEIIVTAIDMGDAEVNGGSNPVELTDKLPPRLIPTAIVGVAGFNGIRSENSPVMCKLSSLTCTFAGGLPPFEQLEMRINVKVLPGPSEEAQNEASVLGGEAAMVTIKHPVAINTAPAAFGVENYEFTPEGEDGTLDTQAGSHPFQLSTTVALNELTEAGHAVSPTLPKDLHFDLPPGLVGNPTAVPRCTYLQFSVGFNGVNGCPANTAVGVMVATLVDPTVFKTPNAVVDAVPVFNLEPGAGEPARFGFFIVRVPVVVDTSIRSGGDYGVTASVNNVSQSATFLASQLTLWGVPGDPRHNASRGWRCLGAGRVVEGGCITPERTVLTPFLTMPTSCAGPLKSPMQADSWAQPGNYLPPQEPLAQVSPDGCNQLPFGASITVAPNNHAASTPTGVTVNVHVSQDASTAPSGLADSSVKNTTVTLPAGLQISPAASGDLQACTETQVGFQGIEAGGTTIFSESEAQCPEASKLGTVEVTTPILKEALKGYIYQAAQGANPFGSLLALYVVAEAPNAGVRVKLAGKIEASPTTGQLTSTFPLTPQLPFEDFTLEFFGGNRAPLATTSCGAYQTESSIEPWSGQPAATPSSEFDVTSGPGGAPCSSVGGFAPAFVAGTQNNDAAAFSPFVLDLTRKDGEQTLSTMALAMPPGLAGLVSSVALCPEAQANAGMCPAGSKIGHVRISAGVGNEPIVLPEAGKGEDPVYLTESYDGAPFGLSVVVPAEAGPFNLDEGGHPIVVRAKVEVNPYTAQVTVISNPMPTRLQGIPLDVRDVEVVVDRPGFIFNPTSCGATSVAGTIGSSEGANESVSSRFQAANCSTLPFKPSFTAATSATHTRNGGDSLHVVVKSTAGQSNIAATRVELPKSLPSRLSTLNKACPEPTFAANPAACPVGSRIGTATAYTPILSVPLTGPAYFVSHGGAKFPELILVLQGEGVTVQLNGETFISSKGITSSTFKRVPDLPVTRFELILPAGPDSVLTATGDPCAEKLVMPTTITGQNGTVIKQSTQIVVSGCKPAIRVLRHSVEGDTATIVASVPSAGKLVASGEGLSRVARKLKKAGRVTLELTLTKTDRSLLAHHRGRKLKVNVKLRLTPSTGKSLSESVTVLMG